MSFHLLLPLATMALNLGLVGVVFTRAWRVPGRRVFVMFLLTMAAWAGAQSAIELSSSAQTALIWHRLLLVNAILFPPLYLHFSYAFAGREPYRPVLWTAYGVAVVGVGLSLSGLMVREMVPLGASYVPQVSIYFIALMPFLYGTGLIALANVRHTQLHAPSATVRNRASYLLVGTLAAMVLGSVDFATVLGLTNVLVSSAGNLIFGLLATMALLSDRLVDMRTALRRQSAHTALVMVVGGGAILVVFGAAALLGSWPHPVAMAVWVTVVYAFASPYVHQPMHRWVDRVWYGGRLRSLDALERFGSEVRGVRDLQLLSATMVYMVRKATMARHVSLLERAPGLAALRTAASVGLDQEIEIAFGEESALAGELTSAARVLSLGELVDSAAWWSIPRAQQEQLTKADVQLLVPMSFNGHLAGLLLLGPRTDGTPYPQEESEALFAIGSEVAPSIENARLYEEQNGQLREIRETQARLLQAGKLATLGTLASGVAHEICNPLFSIQGRVELLQADAGRHLKTAKAMEYVDVIAEMSQRISTVVNGLLTFSRRDDARGPVDVNQLVEETLGLVERDLAISRVVVRRDLAVELPATFGNAAKLKQALMNVVLNARDAMPGGGALTIATQRDGTRLSITCEDSGRGIRQEELSHIFDAFYTTKEQGHGAGLGLYVCHSIVDEHGGRLDIRSEFRKGTKVTMTLPVGPDAPQLPEPAAPAWGEGVASSVPVPVLANQMGEN